MQKQIRFVCKAVLITLMSSIALVSVGQSEEGNTEQASLEIPAFTYAPSIFASEELKQAYSNSLATPGDGTIPIPKDPRAVQYMREQVNAMFEQILPMVHQWYPVNTEAANIDGVEVIRVTPRDGITQANRKRVLINLHGGAFMVGWPSIALLDAVPVAALTGIEVITLNYRMYPEAVHPAALEDLSVVYRELLKNYDAENIGIFGGSAGGVVTLQAIPWFKEHGLPRPGAIAPLAASFRTAVGDSSIWNYKGGFTSPGADGPELIAKGGYFADLTRAEGVSDTSADVLTLYPPTLLLAGTRAPELSGAVDAHTRLLKHGVDSQLYVIEGGWHSSYSTAPQTPESQDAMRYVARWFDQHLGN